MKTLLVGIALGATALATQALAQEAGDMMQGDMTRAEAQQRADSMFQRIDLNHDGVVTRQEAEQVAAQFGARGEKMVNRMFGDAQSITLKEAETQALARFDRDDLNHDGVVTAAERQQARAALKAARAAGQNPGQ